MNYFRRMKAFRSLCRVLAFLVTVPCLVSLAPLPADAQLPETMQVAVLDFVNKTSFGGDDTGKLASDALVVELKKSDRFDVVMRSVLQDGMDKLGLRPPLERRQLLRLGEEVMKGEYGQASAMIEGEVAAVKIKAKPRSAEVAVIVRVIDVASGEIINGAAAYGKSNLRVGYDSEDDQMVTEAIEDAAYQAVKAMIAYIIPEATVQNTIGTNEVLLNKGAREGIKRGMSMIVFRSGEMVGKVVVGDVTPNDSTAKVVYAPKGVKPEDKVRAVFDAPQVQSGARQRTSDIQSGAVARSNPDKGDGVRSSKSKVLLMLLAALGIAALVKGGSGTESVGTVSAQAGSAPWNPAFPSTGAIRISYDPGKLYSGKNVLEYHIWRDNSLTPVAAPAPTVPFCYDDAGAGTRNVPYRLVDRVANTAVLVDENAVNRAEYGVPHRYQVSAVYQVIGSTGTTPKTYETERSDTGWATILTPMMVADLLQPVPGDQNVDPSKGIQFQFNSRRGASKYIIQISSRADFASPEWTSPDIPPGLDTDGVPMTYTTGNIRSFLSSTSGTLYWRVGAKNNADTPGPIGGWQFSEYSHFMLEEGPIDPPA